MRRVNHQGVRPVRFLSTHSVTVLSQHTFTAAELSSKNSVRPNARHRTHL